MNMMLAVIKAKFTEVHESQETEIQGKKQVSYDEEFDEDDDQPFFYTVK